MSAFVDEALIEVVAGRGGDGASHFHREKFAPRGGPDGGDGGQGGDVILEVDEDLRTLVDFRYQPRFEAEPGVPGSGNNCTGANGASRTVRVPLGCLVYDQESGELLADLSTAGQTQVIAAGGKGGRGNARFATPSHRAPIRRELGAPGERRSLRLELKLLADAALVGFPNAGKSTLISRLSSARPKIADYPFTTLTPHLGVVRVDDGASFVIADLPGLIEGAAEGRGLGHQFLRHLERARVIVHLLDMSGWERDDPVADYLALRRELEQYDPRLADLPELVVATKMDLPDAATMLELVREPLAAAGVEVIVPISAVAGSGVSELARCLLQMVEAADTVSLVERQAAELAEEHARRQAEAPDETDDPDFMVEIDEEGVYHVSGTRVEHQLAICDLDNEESLLHLHRELVRMGVIRGLREAGCADGDVVCIGGEYLDFQE